MFSVGRQAAAGPSSSLETHRDQIKRRDSDGINGRVLHRVLMEAHGYRGSYSSVYRMMRCIKAATPRLTTVLDFAPGDTAQVDFGKGPEVVDQHTGEVQKTWSFVIVLACSRHMCAELVTDQSIETWLGCHRRAFEHFGGVPALCSIDNLKAAITRAWNHDRQVQHSDADYAEGYGFIIAPCPVADPQKKGASRQVLNMLKTTSLHCAASETWWMPMRSFFRWYCRTAAGSTRRYLTGVWTVMQRLLIN